jgi:hypothetical protein
MVVDGLIMFNLLGGFISWAAAYDRLDRIPDWLLDALWALIYYFHPLIRAKPQTLFESWATTYNWDDPVY